MSAHIFVPLGVFYAEARQAGNDVNTWLYKLSTKIGDSKQSLAKQNALR